jgi:hypothetical protein
MYSAVDGTSTCDVEVVLCKAAERLKEVEKELVVVP